MESHLTTEERYDRMACLNAADARFGVDSAVSVRRRFLDEITAAEAAATARERERCAEAAFAVARQESGIDVAGAVVRAIRAAAADTPPT